MPMRDYEELKDIDIPINIDIPSVQKAMVRVMRDAYEDCRTSSCNGCSDWKRAFNSMMSCILFKYARKLCEAGFRQTEKGADKDE